MDLEEIEDLVFWNLSFGVKVEETLKELDKMELKKYFDNLICQEKLKQ